MLEAEEINIPSGDYFPEVPVGKAVARGYIPQVTFVDTKNPGFGARAADSLTHVSAKGKFRRSKRGRAPLH